MRESTKIIRGIFAAVAIILGIIGAVALILYLVRQCYDKCGCDCGCDCVEDEPSEDCDENGCCYTNDKDFVL